MLAFFVVPAIRQTVKIILFSVDVQDYNQIIPIYQYFLILFAFPGGAVDK